jgi:hypothetical protein
MTVVILCEGKIVMKKYFFLIAIFAVTTNLFISCHQQSKANSSKKFVYETFRDSIKRIIPPVVSADTSNFFDNSSFIPGKDSLDSLLVKLDTLIRRDAALIEKLDTMVSRLKNQLPFTSEERMAIKSNLEQLDSFLLFKHLPPRSVCSKTDCLIYAEVIKSRQIMYLYIEGELLDSFKVSTGMKGYTTPSMDLKPHGPVLAKYSSKKFPGGNYKGLGNMPYAVFLKGGYAIHGTTTGNFSKLGRTASHGCIRLHPDNAIIFYELVKLLGLKNTWVSVK